MESLVVAAVSTWYLVCAGYAATVAVAAIRTGAYAPELGIELRGRAAVVAGWVTLLLAAALFTAGAYISFVATRA